MLCVLLLAGMASAAVKDRLNRLGQGVLQPSAGLAALAAVLRSASGLINSQLAAPSALLGGSASAAVVTVNPFKWATYFQQMQVCCFVAGRLHFVRTLFCLFLSVEFELQLQQVSCNRAVSWCQCSACGYFADLNHSCSPCSPFPSHTGCA